jgi:hypothetical protein
MHVQGQDSDTNKNPVASPSRALDGLGWHLVLLWSEAPGGIPAKLDDEVQNPVKELVQVLLLL